MNENPYHNEPGKLGFLSLIVPVLVVNTSFFPAGFEAANPFASRNYNDCIRHETLRVAVCEMADQESTQHQMLPDQFKEIISALYPSFAESYVLTCNDYIGKDGSVSNRKLCCVVLMNEVLCFCRIWWTRSESLEANLRIGQSWSACKR
jgi:ubiquitin-conjugating enzyme E2 Z